MNKNKHWQKGFTLVELMIVVAILGILGSIAYPAYTQQMLKSKRSDAFVGVQQVAQLQEEYFNRHMSYADGFITLGYTSSPIKSPNQAYNISLTVEPAGCSGNTVSPCLDYTISARPATAAQQKDKECAVISYDNVGRKSSKTSSGTTSTTCWK